MTDLQVTNLDIHLAKIIHDALLNFKERLPEGLIIYSKAWEKEDYNWHSDENVSNDTDWFINELLWTFNHIQGEEETSESTLLFKRMSEGILNIEEVSAEKIQNSLDSLKNHPDYALYKGLQRKEAERVKNGLNLFAKYFRSLWY
jgi:hypothetical protein